jgi:light-regulated signal transduction histidine kinase (bacteriophytochrome)
MCGQIIRVIKAEQARDKALTALEQMNRDLERRIKERTEELEAANQHLEAFSYSVSHDLRAPLRQISGFAAILSQDHGGTLEAGAQEHLASIQSAASGMTNLIDALLEMGKAERKPLRLKPVDFNSVVHNVIRELESEWRGRGTQWRIAHLPTVQCDPDLIHSVFDNLLSNAVKYTRYKERATIEVGFDTINGFQAIFVRDNGAGFDPKYADKLFGVFQRLHLSEEFEGTGVGLATVERIIRKHGWRIWAESSPRLGATFFFTTNRIQEASEFPMKSRDNLAVGSGG